MVELPFRFAYLLLCVPFLAVWLILFFTSRRTRDEQLTMSWLAMVLGPLSEVIYFRDYWLPESVFPIFIGEFPFMVEDLLFGFSIGGIGAVIFEVVFRKRLVGFSRRAKHAISSLTIGFIFCIALLTLLALGLNSIYASALAFVIAAIPIVYLRHDLLVNSIGSGIGVMLVMFLCYFFLYHLISNTEELLRKGWLLYDTSLDTRFANIPLTEMAWGFTWGFFAGPLYEYLRNKRTATIRT